MGEILGWHDTFYTLIGKTITVRKWSRGPGGIEERAAFKGEVVAAGEDELRLKVPVMGGPITERIPYDRVIDFIVHVG